VYFSYALTMIADWRRALDNALAMLAPGGTLGVVDFHLPDRPRNRFWAWFSTMACSCRTRTALPAAG
jgi:hypothetical protein